MLPLKFYSQGKLGHQYFFFDPTVNDTNWQRPYKKSKFSIPIQNIGYLKFKRLWVICTSWEKDGSIDENSQKVKKWLDLNLKQELEKEFNGSWLHIYRY